MLTWWQWALIAAVLMIVAWAAWWGLAPLGNNREP